ncbi:hypothetical protein [Cronobacter phage EspYZU08]|nr:hypothetical protein [Cronobacter phage EspYZU08]
MATSGVAGRVYATQLIDLGTGKTVNVADLVNGGGAGGNRAPTTTIRGGVLQQAAIADLTAAPTQADINAILAALRSAGVLAS